MDKSSTKVCMSLPIPVGCDFWRWCGSEELFLLYLKFSHYIFSINFSKEDPKQSLSRWGLVIVLLPVIWVDALKATIHRTVVLATEISLPIILRFVVEKIAIGSSLRNCLQITIDISLRFQCLHTSNPNWWWVQVESIYFGSSFVSVGLYF